MTDFNSKNLNDRFNENIIIDDCNEIILEYKRKLKLFKNKKILITGGGGFLLSYFVDLIATLNSQLNLNIKLDIYDYFYNGFPNRLNKYKKNQNIKFYNLDVSKKIKLVDEYSLIIHGASIASPTYYKKFPIETIKVNTIGLLNLLDFYKESKKLKNFIYMSSSEVYGDPSPASVPTKEDYNGNVSFTGPRACYDESKRIGETISINYFKIHKLPIKIIRPFNVYGPGQNIDDKRIIPDLIKFIKNNKNIEMYSDGKPKRSFCYISDQIRGILEVIFNGDIGEPYNVGNNQEISMLEAAKSAIKLSKKRINIIMKENNQKDYNKDSPQRRCPDLKKLKNIGSWKPKYTFVKGMKKTLEYYNIK